MNEFNYFEFTRKNIGVSSSEINSQLFQHSMSKDLDVYLPSWDKVRSSYKAETENAGKQWTTDSEVALKNLYERAESNYKEYTDYTFQSYDVDALVPNTLSNINMGLTPTVFRPNMTQKVIEDMGLPLIYTPKYVQTPFDVRQESMKTLYQPNSENNAFYKYRTYEKTVKDIFASKGTYYDYDDKTKDVKRDEKGNAIEQTADIKNENWNLDYFSGGSKAYDYVWTVKVDVKTGKPMWVRAGKDSNLYGIDKVSPGSDAKLESLEVGFFSSFFSMFPNMLGRAMQVTAFQMDSYTGDSWDNKPTPDSEWSKSLYMMGSNMRISKNLDQRGGALESIPGMVASVGQGLESYGTMMAFASIPYAGAVIGPYWAGAEAATGAYEEAITSNLFTERQAQGYAMAMGVAVAITSAVLNGPALKNGLIKMGVKAPGTALGEGAKQARDKITGEVIDILLNPDTIKRGLIDQIGMRNVVDQMGKKMLSGRLGTLMEGAAKLGKTKVGGIVTESTGEFVQEFSESLIQSGLQTAMRKYVVPRNDYKTDPNKSKYLMLMKLGQSSFSEKTWGKIFHEGMESGVVGFATASTIPSVRAVFSKKLIAQQYMDDAIMNRVLDENGMAKLQQDFTQEVGLIQQGKSSIGNSRVRVDGSVITKEDFAKNPEVYKESQAYSILEAMYSRGVYLDSVIKHLKVTNDKEYEKLRKEGKLGEYLAIKGNKLEIEADIYRRWNNLYTAQDKFRKAVKALTGSDAKTGQQVPGLEYDESFLGDLKVGAEEYLVSEGLPMPSEDQESILKKSKPDDKVSELDKALDGTHYASWVRYKKALVDLRDKLYAFEPKMVVKEITVKDDSGADVIRKIEVPSEESSRQFALMKAMEGVLSNKVLEEETRIANDPSLDKEVSKKHKELAEAYLDMATNRVIIGRMDMKESAKLNAQESVIKDKIAELEEKISKASTDVERIRHTTRKEHLQQMSQFSGKGVNIMPFYMEARKIMDSAFLNYAKQLAKSTEGLQSDPLLAANDPNITTIFDINENIDYDAISEFFIGIKGNDTFKKDGVDYKILNENIELILKDGTYFLLGDKGVTLAKGADFVKDGKIEFTEIAKQKIEEEFELSKSHEFSITVQNMTDPKAGNVTMKFKTLQELEEFVGSKIVDTIKPKLLGKGILLEESVKKDVDGELDQHEIDTFKKYLYQSFNRSAAQQTYFLANEVGKSADYNRSLLIAYTNSGTLGEASSSYAKGKKAMDAGDGGDAFNALGGTKGSNVLKYLNDLYVMKTQMELAESAAAIFGGSNLYFSPLKYAMMPSKPASDFLNGYYKTLEDNLIDWMRVLSESKDTRYGIDDKYAVDILSETVKHLPTIAEALGNKDLFKGLTIPKGPEEAFKVLGEITKRIRNHVGNDTTKIKKAYTDVFTQHAKGDILEFNKGAENFFSGDYTGISNIQIIGLSPFSVLNMSFAEKSLEEIAAVIQDKMKGLPESHQPSLEQRLASMQAIASLTTDPSLTEGIAQEIAKIPFVGDFPEGSTPPKDAMQARVMAMLNTIFIPGWAGSGKTSQVGALVLASYNALYPTANKKFKVTGPKEVHQANLKKSMDSHGIKNIESIPNLDGIGDNDIVLVDEGTLYNNTDLLGKFNSDSNAGKIGFPYSTGFFNPTVKVIVMGDDSQLMGVDIQENTDETGKLVEVKRRLAGAHTFLRRGPTSNRRDPFVFTPKSIRLRQRYRSDYLVFDKLDSVYEALGSTELGDYIMLLDKAEHYVDADVTKWAGAKYTDTQEAFLNDLRLAITGLGEGHKDADKIRVVFHNDPLEGDTEPYDPFIESIRKKIVAEFPELTVTNVDTAQGHESDMVFVMIGKVPDGQSHKMHNSALRTAVSRRKHYVNMLVQQDNNYKPDLRETALNSQVSKKESDTLTKFASINLKNSDGTPNKTVVTSVTNRNKIMDTYMNALSNRKPTGPAPASGNNKGTASPGKTSEGTTAKVANPVPSGAPIDMSKLSDTAIDGAATSDGTINPDDVAAAFRC